MISTNNFQLPAVRGRSAALVLLVATTILVFLFGGGARDDIQSLLLLRPLSAMSFIAAVSLCLPGVWRDHRAVLALAAAWGGLILLHLLPLPPVVWTRLPGRAAIVDFYAAANMPLPWTPVSIAPDVTWNALFALFAPMAILILSLSLSRDRLFIMLRVLIVIGFVSGLVGLLQAINPERSALYFYRITNERSAVGLFANRNHQALLLACIFPMLATHLSLLTGRPEKLLFYKRLTIVGVALLVPLLLVTGSRVGLIAGVVGVALGLAIYRAPVPVGRVVKGSRVSPIQTLLAIVGVIVVAVVTLATSRATAVQRLLGEDIGNDLRAKIAPILWDAAGTYFPVGSGIGSFVQTYALVEPDALLAPNYFNHAHNDFLELLLTGGLPAMVLLVWAAALYLIAAYRLVWPADPDVRRAPAAILGRFGLAVIAILAIGSATDYPLRTPSLAGLGVFAVAAIAVAMRELALAGLSGHTRHGPLADAEPAGKNQR